MIGNKVIGHGPTPALIAIVGEGTGMNEAEQGVPFIGASGLELNNYLIRCAGLYRSEVFVTNIVKWRTDENDSDPTDKDIERDKEELYEELRRVTPFIIVAVGKIAAQFFLGKSAKMEFVHGLPFDPIDPVAKELGCKVLPVFHPAAGIRQPDRYGKLVWDDFCSLGKLLRGEMSFDREPDKYPSPNYYLAPPQLLATLDPSLPIALDTEGWVDDPYSLQVTQREGEAAVITEPSPDCHVFDGKALIGHHTLHDLPVIRALGVSTDKADLHDTMIMSYLLGLTPKALKPLSYRLNDMKMGSYAALVHTSEIEKVNEYLNLAWTHKLCVVCEGRGKFQRLAKKKGKIADDKCALCSGTGEIPKLGKKGQLLKTLVDCPCVVLVDVPLKSDVRCPACTDGASWPPPPVLYDEEGKLKKPWSISRRLRKMIAEINAPIEDDEEDGDDVDEDEASHPLRKRWSNIDPEIRRPVEEAIGRLPRTTLRDVKDKKAVVDYAGRDADATLRDFNLMLPMIRKQGLERVYDIDRGILPMLDRMQSVGMLVDLDYFAGFQSELETELVIIQDRLSGLVGYTINAGSSDQVSELLYGKLQLDPPKFSKKTEKPSTDAKSMESLKIRYAFDDRLGPIIDAILDYREHAKMLGTYVLPIQRLADRNSRIHTQLLYTNTASGRLASRNINLQNIPTRSELGKRVRKGFIALPGCVLLSVDLDQIELRVGAHLSRDENMIDVFRTGKDIHRATAALVYKIAMEVISSDQRVAAKCFHPDTEVLSRAGWKKIVDLGPEEEIIQAIPGEAYSVQLEWAKPLEVFTKKHPSQALVHLKNEGMDLRVTPDHRMLVWKNDKAKFRVVMPDEVADARGWANAGMLHNPTTKVNEQLLRLAVATQADGSITPSETIRFGFTKQRKIDRIRTLLSGLEFTEGIYKNGKNPNVTWFHIKKEGSTEILKLLDHDKTLPWHWLSLSCKDREIVLEEAAYWDSCKLANWRAYQYSSSIKKNVEVLQAVASITNRKTRLTGPFNQNQWKLTIRAKGKNNTRGGNLVTTIEEYKDEVACLSVPSTFVLVRGGESKIPVVCGQTVNFGIFYGMKATRLMNELALLGIKISKQEAMDFIEAWFEAYPGVKKYMSDLYAEARQTGAVRTMFGRLRYLPGVWSPLEGLREEALRQVGNQPVQGTAGEIMKIGMKNVNDRVLPDARKIAYCEPLVPVHDELIFEVEESLAPLVKSQVEYEMSRAVELLVPLGAKGNTAKNWGELK